jgi:hypothetical protein
MNIIIYLALSYVLSLILMGLFYYIHSNLNNNIMYCPKIEKTYTKIVWPILWFLFFVSFL